MSSSKGDKSLIPKWIMGSKQSVCTEVMPSLVILRVNTVGIQAGGDVMIGQHGRSVHDIFVGQRRFPLPFLFYHHLEINNQSIKPTVERLTYFIHNSPIIRGLHLLTNTESSVETSSTKPLEYLTWSCGRITRRGRRVSATTT